MSSTQETTGHLCQNLDAEVDRKTLYFLIGLGGEKEPALGGLALADALADGWFSFLFTSCYINPFLSNGVAVDACWEPEL